MTLFGSMESSLCVCCFLTIKHTINSTNFQPIRSYSKTNCFYSPLAFSRACVLLRLSSLCSVSFAHHKPPLEGDELGTELESVRSMRL